jgi:hypothetical protein
MLNPMMDMVRELKKMNDKLTEQLDAIIQRLDILIDIEMEPDNG